MHGGQIQGITGGGENPAIGFSPDYGVLSEYGLYNNYDQFDPAFFPAIERRTHAACRIETTPGTYNSAAHERWTEAMSSSTASRWLPVFLAWWRDMLCVSVNPVPAGFTLTPEEADFKRRVDLFDAQACRERPKWWRYTGHVPISEKHMWFRRETLASTFHQDPRLFASKYPSSPYEGWLISSSPTIPADAIEKMMPTAVDVPYGEEKWFEVIDPNTPYLITVDGKGYGKKGDPAAMTLWNLWTWSEAASWSGDEDPGEITPRVLRWQWKTNAHVIVETNKDGVAAALQASNCPRLFWSGEQPGWFSTEVSKKAALIDLVSMLRAGEITIRTLQTLQQLASWDGKTRAQETGRRKHHWDRAITVLIFAYGVVALGKPQRPRIEVLPVRPEGAYNAAEFASWFDTPVTSGRVLGPP